MHLNSPNYPCTIFIRKKRTPLSKKTAVQLVKSIRYKGKVKQKIVRYFGHAFNEGKLKVLKNIVLKYKLDLEDKRKPVLFETGTVMDSVVEAAKGNDDNKPLPVDLRNIVE